MEQISFHQQKLHFRENILADFHCILNFGSFRTVITKIFTVRNTMNLRILSSVATLETPETENGKKTNCYKLKKKTTGVTLE